MKVKTKSGFKCEIDESILGDYRLVRALAKADKEGDNAAMLQGTAEVMSLMFGKNEDALIDYIASKNDGKVPQEIIFDDLKSVFEQMREAKNS